MRKFFPHNNNLLYLFALGTSLLFSLWVACREVVINPDAICYLQSAAIIGDGGLRKAMNLCGQAQWPFYSALIYFTANLTFLSLTAAAYTLDAIFTALSVL